MLRNYLKIAGRNLVRNLSFAAINISGLALGLASAMLIFLWVQDELSIGRQYKNADRLYRIMEREFTDGKVVSDENTPGILADELKRVFPEVVYAAGFSSSESHMLTVAGKSLRQSGNFAGPTGLIYITSRYWLEPRLLCVTRVAWLFPGNWPKPTLGRYKMRWGNRSGSITKPTGR